MMARRTGIGGEREKINKNLQPVAKSERNRIHFGGGGEKKKSLLYSLDCVRGDCCGYRFYKLRLRSLLLLLLFLIHLLLLFLSASYVPNRLTFVCV